jgi:hypothetical protein
MDFRQTVQPNPRPNGAGTPPVLPAHEEEKESKGNLHTSISLSRWTRIFTVVILLGITVLLAAIAVGIRHSPSDNEGTYIDTSKYQAVFLNNSQVYFGKVKNLNDQYVRMTNVYYLTQATGTSTSGTSSNYSLVKLGCQQIHDPTDAMVINRSEVSFWENLENKGKVVTSINKFKQQNPNGPDCTQVSNQTQASNTATQGGDTSTPK